MDSDATDAEPVRDVFLSYASQDLALAERMVSWLPPRFSVWFDKERIRGGTNWVRRLEVESARARALVAIVSPDWEKSQWTRFEAYGSDEPFFVDLLAQDRPGRLVPPAFRHFQILNVTSPS
jgi:hypothetical protein